MRGLLYEEIVPTIAYRVDDVAEFADETFDRFRNPFMRHKLADIAANHAAKAQVRLQPTYDEYVKLFNRPPKRWPKRCRGRDRDQLGDRRQGTGVSRTNLSSLSS